MADVIVRGPTIAGTYNVIVLNGAGVAGMSLTLTDVAELHKQLGALLESKVKDQPKWCRCGARFDEHQFSDHEPVLQVDLPLESVYADRAELHASGLEG